MRPAGSRPKEVQSTLGFGFQRCSPNGFKSPDLGFKFSNFLVATFQRFGLGAGVEA